MSKAACQLLSALTVELYGEKSAKIVSFLLTYGPAQISQIVLFLKQKYNIQLLEAKHLISILINHDIIIFKEENISVLYEVDQNNLLNLIKLPKYLYYIKLKFGELAYLIANEVVNYGKLDIISIVSVVSSKFQGHGNIYNIKDTLYKLISCKIFKRCPWLNSVNTSTNAIPSLTYNYSYAFDLPNGFDFSKEWEIEELTLKKNSVENPRIKRLKIDYEGDSLIYWSLNNYHLDFTILGQIMVQALERRYLNCIPHVAPNNFRIQEIDASKLLSRTLLAAFESTISKESKCSDTSVTFNINQLMSLIVKNEKPKHDQQSLIKHIIVHQLDFLSDMDTCKWAHKQDETGGGNYRFDVQSCVKDLFDEITHTFIRHRFGSKAARIYKLVKCKRYTEQKRIEECAMMSSKQCKELLYTLLTAGFVQDFEVSKTPDHAPSRTFYLFGVNEKTVARRLLDVCYKTYTNLINQRNKELADGERLFDKRDKIEAIVNTLLAFQGSADYATQIDGLRASITPQERQKIQEITAAADKLDCAQIALVETIMVITSYLSYAYH